MEIILSSPRGFCAGVVRAIEIVEKSLAKFGAPIYVKHEIVHNPYVVKSLADRGAKTVEDVDDIPPDSVVIFSAHGSPPEDFAKAQARNLQVIDATCPLVTRVHNEANKYSREGKRIILIGHKGHAEVRGTMGQTSMALVDGRESMNLPNWDPNTEVAILTQTTLSVDDTEATVAHIKSRFPNNLVRNDVCYATTNRQDAVKQLTKLVGLVLVIGADKSSNCNRLREVAESNGVPAYLINNASDIDMNWTTGISVIGITSGASTPETLVDQVITKLKPTRISTLDGISEDVTFVLPVELRD
jgi:4-hydroxy-3-methylbut-2-enyl diphosphate reductase